MIPYFTIPPVHLFGSVSLQVYGVLSVIGIVLAYQLMMRRARKLEVSAQSMQRALIWTFIVGLVGAHVVELLFYQPQTISTEGLWVFFRVFSGLSSIGAVLGGLLGLWIYCKRKGVACIPHLSIIVEGFVVWWAFLRLGCTLSHDHLGTPTAFLLAFDYPWGPRHNLGFYEFLVVILVLVPLTIYCRRRRVKPENYVGIMFVAYSALRFGLDFLRATDLPGADPRYWGLTVAQYGCLVMVGAGAYLLFFPARIGKTRLAKQEALNLRTRDAASMS